MPVVITDVNDLKSLEFAIVENVQRHDLNAIEDSSWLSTFNRRILI